MANQVSKSDFNQTVGKLFQGMDAFLTSKTVVGDPIQVGETTLIPLVDVNFGVGAGAMGSARGSNNAFGSVGGKLSPSAVIVLQNGNARIMPIAEESTLSKVLDMIPGVTSKIQDLLGKNKDKEAVEEAIETLEDKEF